MYYIVSLVKFLCKVYDIYISVNNNKYGSNKGGSKESEEF